MHIFKFLMFNIICERSSKSSSGLRCNDIFECEHVSVLVAVKICSMDRAAGILGFTMKLIYFSAALDVAV